MKVNYIEQLQQTLESAEIDSKEYKRLDGLLRKLNQASKFDETLDSVDELVVK